MLYFGLWLTTFCAHTEDLDLASINTLVYGAAKIWYTVAPQYGHLLENLAREIISKDEKSARHYSDCKQPLRHKALIFSPALLERHKIPYNRVVQYANQTIITSPYCYHMGFNTEFNIAEARNLATPSWLAYGKAAIQCCKNLPHPFDISNFVKKYESEGPYAMFQAIVKTPKPDLPTEQKLNFMQMELETLAKKYINLKKSGNKLLTVKKKSSLMSKSKRLLEVIH